MYRRLGILALAVAMAAVGLLAASCGSGGNNAQYRVVQAIPDAPANLDVSVNGKAAFADLGFGAVGPASGYQSISAGSDPLEVFLTGTTTPVISSHALNLVPTSQSTALLTGLYVAPTAVILLDNNATPPAGQVELRVIDASPSAPASLDVYMVSPGSDISTVAPVISPLQLGQASLYIPLNTQSSTGLARIMVIVTATGSKAQLLNQIYTPSVGQIRSLVLVDNPPPNGGTMSYVPLELNDLN